MEVVIDGKSDNIENTMYNNHVNKDADLYGILIKTTLLTFIALCTTPLCLILSGSIGLSIWLPIDQVVNCFCIILMFRTHQKLYNRMCHKLEPLITNKCLALYTCSCCCDKDQIDSKTSNGNDDKDQIDSEKTKSELPTK